MKKHIQKVHREGKVKAEDGIHWIDGDSTKKDCSESTEYNNYIKYQSRN